ncbi:uncharacterized protein [Panulirus ornatus]|uniref:uncharacterized protein n=1 Tax=Panulirus ornatus TaxID=150431 RepID=UPI003A84B504
MFVKSLILTVCMAGVSLGLPRSRRDSTPTDFELPANASAILVQPLQTGFACDQRVYGFYADVDNRCQVFHVCYPFVDVDLLIKMRMFTFICGPGLIFDQEKLVRFTNCFMTVYFMCGGVAARMDEGSKYEYVHVCMCTCLRMYMYVYVEMYRYEYVRVWAVMNIHVYVGGLGHSFVCFLALPR